MPSCIFPSFSSRLRLTFKNQKKKVGPAGKQRKFRFNTVHERFVSTLASASNDHPAHRIFNHVVKIDSYLLTYLVSVLLQVKEV